MAIHKLKKHQNSIPYEMVSREVAQSITNPNALAIWLYLLTKPEDWTVRRTDIKSHFSIGDVGYKKAVDQLVELGLFHKEFVRSDSGLFTDSIIHIYPFPNRIADNRNSGKSIDGEPDNRINSNLKENRLFKEEDIPTENKTRTVCPYEEIREIYNSVVPVSNQPYKKVNKLTDKRKRLSQKFYINMGKDLDTIREYFKYFIANAQDWQKGMTERKWIATYEYIIHEDTVEKCREGEI